MPVGLSYETELFPIPIPYPTKGNLDVCKHNIIVWLL